MISKKDSKLNNVVVKDFSGLQAVCKTVYFPKNIKRVIEIIKIANSNKLKVIPIGGKTGTAGGYSGKIDIGIDLSNFSYIKHDHSDVFIVGAGTKVGLFNKYLKKIGLVVPMTEAPGACIGGAIATDNPGKPYHDFGLAGHVNSVTVISPMGKKVVFGSNDKDNTLFYSTIGGEGLTGVIVEAEFKPIKIKNRLNINLSFKPNDFIFLEKFWQKIIFHENQFLAIRRGVIFPLGLLQIRAVSDDEIILSRFNKKVNFCISCHKNISRFDGQIPIGEMIIHQVSAILKTRYKFFPAISNIEYQDKKLNDILIKYSNKNKIGFIKEFKIGPMKVQDNSDNIFNGRIPDFTEIKKFNGLRADVKIINYGGSNIGGGTHIAFLGNDLKQIKYHAKKIFKILHRYFPQSKTNEHKASLIRGSQILFMEGKKGLLLRKKIRDMLDPNKVIFTTALQDIDKIKI